MVGTGQENPFTCLLLSSKVPDLQMSRGPTKPELESLTGFAAELYIQVRQGGSLGVGPTWLGTVQRYVKLCSGATETPLWDRPLKQGLQGYSQVSAQTQLHPLTSYFQSRLYFIHVNQTTSEW